MSNVPPLSKASWLAAAQAAENASKSLAMRAEKFKKRPEAYAFLLNEAALLQRKVVRFKERAEQAT